MPTDHRITRSLPSGVLAVALLVPGGTVAARRGPAPDPFPSAEPAAEEPKVPDVAIVRVESSEDEVVLLDGSFLRGKIVELANGSHVTIVLLGEPRKITWAELQEIRLGTAPIQSITPTTQSGTPHTKPPEPVPAEPQPEPLNERVSERSSGSSGPSGLYVHIDSTNGRPVTLYGITGEFAGSASGTTVAGIFYRPICRGTCDQVVDASSGTDFFIGGNGITPSRHFSLDEGSRVTLEVKAGRFWAWATGWSLLGVGAGLLITGPLFLAMSNRERIIPNPESDKRMRRLGVGALLGGVLTVGVTIPLLVLGRTIVKKR